jgi:HAD superfamily phosphoserine phosphatase-like hydrolase
MTASRVYAFDLDGTVTRAEILPRIASALDLADEMELLTRLTLDGTLPFAASFRLRFHILRGIPLPRIQKTVAAIPLDPHIEDFIRTNRERCVLVTGNLDVWIEPLARRLDCRVFCSRSSRKGGRLRLAHILDKGEAVRALQAEGRKVVAIGESVNDIPMFEAADHAIAYGGLHRPVPDLLRLADHAVYDGAALCALLRDLV